MTAWHQISGLLRDAEYIAEANRFVVLRYLIKMALLHMENERPATSADQRVRP